MLQHFRAVIIAGAVAFPGFALADQFNGTWSGKWDGKSTVQIRVANDKVQSYYFRGRAVNVGKTTIKGNTLRFGSDYSVTMTLTGPKTANAHYVGRGTANAALTRK